MKVELLAEDWDTQMTTKNSKSNYFVLDLHNSFSDEKCLTEFYIRMKIVQKSVLQLNKQSKIKL